MGTPDFLMLPHVLHAHLPSIPSASSCANSSCSLPVQDPLNLSGKNLAEFDHVKKELTVESAEERAAREVWRILDEGRQPQPNPRRLCTA